ncbi:hypothetical protein CBW65_22025 [Tumebacillus avium]|uniref:Cytosolic protein n=1 Tax=Tumebacillus avium TaxID=1903704 RepID=A0A1Y0IV58_9BACL|nr:hypothetical protein [Tumebacillus avium]ARU63365.1 hypothetical protein CBW65_22025 [Tumebacillus avium]
MEKKDRKKWFRNYELEYVQSVSNTLVPEEFPEGPYGASVFNDQHLGKSSPWEPGQHTNHRFFDENPAFTDEIAHPEDADLPDL